MVREKPEALTSPEPMNQIWSMNFMHDQLSNGRSIRLFSRSVRYEWLVQYLFESIDEVQFFATRYPWKYNNENPNMAFGGFTPKQRLAMVD